MDIELSGQLQLRLVILCHHQQARGVLVYPVDQHSHSLILSVRTLGYAKVEGQGIHKRTAEMAVTRMDHHSGRLVNDQHVIVLVDYVQRDVLRKYFQAPSLIGHHEGHHIAGTYNIVGLDDLVVHPDILGLDGQLDTVAGCVLHVGGEPLVHSDRFLTRSDVEAVVLEHPLLLVFRKGCIVEEILLHLCHFIRVPSWQDRPRARWSSRCPW